VCWSNKSSRNKCIIKHSHAKERYIKSVPISPWRWQGGEEYRSYSFLTSAVDGGEWSASLPDLTLPPAEITPPRRYPLDRRLDGPQSWSGRRGYRKNSFASVGDRTAVARSFSLWSDTVLTELPGSTNEIYALKLTFFLECLFIMVYLTTLVTAYIMRHRMIDRSMNNSFTGAYSPGWTFGLPFGISWSHTCRHTVWLLWTSGSMNKKLEKIMEGICRDLF
jgi:hypothetical protein